MFDLDANGQEKAALSVKLIYPEVRRTLASANLAVLDPIKCVAPEQLQIDF